MSSQPLPVDSAPAVPPTPQVPGVKADVFSPSARRGIGLLLILLVLADVARRLGVTLLRDDLFVGDAAQHTWWMYRFADPALFPNDLAAKYMSMLVFSTPGYQAIFYLLAPLVDAQRLAESIAIVLALAGAGLAWLVGRRIGGFVGGAAAVGVWVVSGSAQLVEGGFPRSFGIVLLLAGMLALLHRRWLAFGLLMLAVTLFYPPMVLNLTPVAAGVLLVEILRERRLPKGFFALCVCGAIALTIVATLYLRPFPPEIGRWTSFAEARQMDEWGRHGRVPYFRPWRVFYFHSSTAGIGLTMLQAGVAGLALLATLIARRRGWRVIGLEAWLLLLGALGFWALSHAVAFKLYLPSRYTSYALPVFFMMWAAGLAGALASRRGQRETPLPSHAKRSLALGAVVLLCAFGIIRSTTQAIAAYQRGPLWDPPAGYDQAMALLRTLPPETLIAAHPVDANPIPLYTRRPVLVNDEVSIPFHVGYYAEMKRRLAATFEMLYADSWQTIDTVADREGVQLFLLNRRRLTNPSAPYRQPWDRLNEPAIARGHFAMLDPPADRVWLTTGDIILLKVGSQR